MKRLALGALFASLCFASQAQAQTTLSLAEVMDAVSSNNLQLQAGDAQIAQAQELRTQAISQTRPQISVQGIYTFRDEQLELESGNPYAPLAPYLEAIAAEHPDAGVPDPDLFTQETGDPQIIQYRHDISGSLIVEQTLFNARSRPYLRQTEVMIEQAENGQAWTLYQLQGVALQAYFQALLQQRLIEVAERNAEMAQLTYDAAAGLHEFGAGNRFQINRAQVELSRANREVENAQTSYAVALRNLSSLTMTEGGFDVVAPTDLSPPAEREVPQSRPDLVSYDLVADLAGWNVREARARWYPNLVGVARANIQRESAFGGDRFAWAIQIIASWDVFDGGERQAIRRQAEQEMVAADLQREQAVSDLSATIDTSLLGIEQLERNIESARADVELATENLELTQEAERLGAASGLDSQVAREQLFLSELSLVTSEVSLQAQIYELHLLIGSEPWL
ncbi:MAG: outer membrane protein TolC [Bradymonadia bacterium]|jgi:outer membrane protein TolC